MIQRAFRGLKVFQSVTPFQRGVQLSQSTPKNQSCEGQSKTDSLDAVVLGYLPFKEIGRAFDSVELHDIFRAHFVERAELFGSAVTGAFMNQSDVDILVTFSAELPILDNAESFLT